MSFLLSDLQIKQEQNAYNVSQVSFMLNHQPNQLCIFLTVPCYSCHMVDLFIVTNPVLYLFEHQNIVKTFANVSV